MDILRKSHKKSSTNSTDMKNLTISAPLGDFRHMAHIGRDGADFGKEHIFTNSTASRSSRTKSALSGFDLTQHESPIIKSSIPVSKAVEVIKKQNNYPSSINDSLSDLVGNASDDNSHYHRQYNQHSSNDNDTYDHDDLLDENHNKNTDDTTSLLGDVLAVMELPKYCTLPGNIGYSKSETSTCSKHDILIPHNSSNNQFQTTSSTSDGVNSTRSYSTNGGDNGASCEMFRYY